MRLLRYLLVRSRPYSTLPVLRKYESECVTACVDALNSGKRRIAVSMGTHDGKTKIFSHLIDQIRKPEGKVLILADRNSIAVQAHGLLSSYNPGLNVQLEAGTKEASPEAEVVIARIGPLQKDRLFKFAPGHFDTIIINDVLHKVTKQYLEVLDHYRATNVIGYSCTLVRPKKEEKDKVFEHLVYHQTLQDYAKQGWLCEVMFSKKDLPLMHVGDEIDFEKMDLRLLEIYQNLTKNNKYKSTVIYCKDAERAKGVTRLFQSKGIKAEIGGTGRSGKKVLDKLKNGQIPVLVCTTALAKGPMIPEIDSIICDRTSRSFNFKSQIVRSVLSSHPGKDCVAIVDIDDKTSVQNVVFAPAIFGLSASGEGSLTELFKQDEQRQLDERDSILPNLCDFESLQEMLEDDHPHEEDMKPATEDQRQKLLSLCKNSDYICLAAMAVAYARVANKALETETPVITLDEFTELWNAVIEDFASSTDGVSSWTKMLQPGYTDQFMEKYYLNMVQAAHFIVGFNKEVSQVGEFGTVQEHLNTIPQYQVWNSVLQRTHWLTPDEYLEWRIV